MRKMKVILGILGGIAAVVFFIFKGMSSSGEPDKITDSTTSSSGMLGDSTAQSSDDSSTNTRSYDTTSTSSTTSTYTPPIVAERWKCIPYEQVGVIKANYSEDDIKKFIGAESVSRRHLGREWGETIPGTVVYPDLPNQLTIEWRDGRPYEVIEKIRIEGDSSNWQTVQGIKIGTTLEELLAINGIDFDFYGFEWDYAGKVDNWRNGKISEGVVVYLNPGNPAAVFPEMIGDTLFSTTHPKAGAAQMTVAAIEIKMRRGIYF